MLDYKIKELKRQIEPREIEIKKMKIQIDEMNIELEQYQKSHTALHLMTPTTIKHRTEHFFNTIHENKNKYIQYQKQK